jgi:Polysaccharide biosynthesis C-terminal domain
MTDAWGMQGTAASFLVSEVCGTAAGMMLTRYAYSLPYLLGPLARTLLASGLMAGAVLALERLLPVPGIAAFAVLAVSGMLVYALAALGLNLCGARTMCHTLSLRMFAAAQRG